MQQNLFDYRIVYDNEDSFNYKGKVLHKGICPHCNQLIEVYNRTFSANHAKTLKNMYIKDKYKYHHYKDVQVEGANDTGKMKYFGLIEKSNNEDPKKKDSGYWKLTEKGIKFVEGKITIPKGVFIYDDTILGFAEEHISISSKLDNFDIREIRATKNDLDTMRLI